MASNEMVLVTGGSGFIGSHTLLQTLLKGYRVRTTVRSLAKADGVKAMLKHGGATDAQVNSVEFCAADLTKDDGWAEACEGCDYVLHVASPFPAAPPKHEDELIIPAREGTLRALKAAKAARTVKRVVVTSSFAAIGYGHPEKTNGTNVYDEKSWTNLENPSNAPSAYAKSKTLAERAAWNFIKESGGDMELAVVNPVAVFGPLLSKEYATSIEIVSRMVNGQIPAVPNLAFGIVDVRDVADLHLRAMTDPKAAGQRFLACADGDFPYLKDIAAMLRAGLPEKEAKRLPTRTAPDFLLRVLGYFDKTVAMVVPELGKYKSGTNAKAKSELGWQPRGAKDSLLASANSLRDFGLVK